MRQIPLGVRIPDRAVFGSFLPARNAEAVDHLKRMAGGASGFAWICGPAGAGKTHLLQAVSVEASRRGSAGYFPLADLEAHGVGALEGLSGLQCLCLDDLDRVVGKPEWERALFGLHREIEDRGARCIAAAAAPPAMLPWSLPDLGSRFSAAAIFQLRVLDETEQRDALRLRASVRGFELPDDTARWLQRRYPRDMRTLYELLDTLDEAALVAQRRLTVPFIRSVLPAGAEDGSTST